MDITAQYKNAEHTVVDAQITNLKSDDFGPELDLKNIDLTLSTLWATHINAWIAEGNKPEAFVEPPRQSVLSQELMAQFSPDDAAAIKKNVDANPSLWLLWSAMQAQSEPMSITNDRFLQGWGALTSILGAGRMAAIADQLQISVSAAPSTQQR